MKFSLKNKEIPLQIKIGESLYLALAQLPFCLQSLYLTPLLPTAGVDLLGGEGASGRGRGVEDSGAGVCVHARPRARARTCAYSNKGGGVEDAGAGAAGVGVLEQEVFPGRAASDDADVAHGVCVCVRARVRVLCADGERALAHGC